MRRLVTIGITLTATVLLLAGTSAQEAKTGRILGRVIDAKTGKPIPFAPVQIENSTMGALTDARGEYIIINVPPGKYDLIVQPQGYLKKRATALTSTAGQTTPQNFALEPLELDSAKVQIISTGQHPLSRRLPDAPELPFLDYHLQFPPLEPDSVEVQQWGPPANVRDSSPARGSAPGKIRGRVTDAETGESISFALVLIDTLYVGAVTGTFGEYQINSVPAGWYTIQVRQSFYEADSVENVRVASALCRYLDLQLKPKSEAHHVKEPIKGDTR